MAAGETEVQFQRRRSSPYTQLRRRVALATTERAQKTEQHLEIVAP
jgi:hypothetical protein